MAPMNVEAIVERLLRDPAFRDLVARDAETALHGYDLDPIWKRAFQEVAQSEEIFHGVEADVLVEPGEAIDAFGREVETPSEGTVDVREWESGGDAAQDEADRRAVEEKEGQREQELEEAISKMLEDARAENKDLLKKALRVIVQAMEARSQALRALTGGSSPAGVQNPEAAEGGKERESPGAASRRASNRLRHRDRAVSLFDYERLVLQKFPVVGWAVAAAGAVAALLLSAWMLTQIQGPRDRELPGVDKGNRSSPTTEEPEADSEEEGSGAASGTTPTAPPPTVTAIPLPITINFNADSYSVERGECTTLRWAVENADSVRLMGAEVESTEAEQVCPREATIYTLRAENRTEEESSSLEIEVTEPTDDLGCIGESNDPCP